MTAVIDIRALRVNRGLSIADASERMGVEVETLRRAERGTARPHPSNAFKIACFFDLQVTDVWPLEEPDREAVEVA